MKPTFTGRGDDGTTGYLGEGRLSKSDLRIEALGSIDEAAAALGASRGFCSPEVGKLLIQVQRDLYGMMGEVAAALENQIRFRAIGSDNISWLESEIERLSQGIAQPDEFIVAGDTVAGGMLDLARAIVRRAERRVVDLVNHGDIKNGYILRYLNRLSSFCYVLELYEYQMNGQQKITLARGKQ